MPSPLDNHPQGTTLATLKGLAIASSFLFAGHLATLSAHLPALYVSADYSHRVAAQQFTFQYRSTKKVLPPTILATGVICSGLAYLGFREQGGREALNFRLWAAAAAAMFATIPATISFMEPPTQRLLWVSEVADSATKTVGPPSSSAVGVKVVDEDAPPQRSGSLSLPVPQDPPGAITPLEDFEPFEDAIIGEEYEQLKVKKLLQKFRWYNSIKVFLPLASGALGLAAVLLE